MNLFNTNYDVYSYSYLCYGQEQARLIYQGQLVQQANGVTLIDDPCLQSDYNQTMTYGIINNTACAIQRYAAPAGFNTTTSVIFR
jgi:adenosinetriphosphatase